MARLFRLLEKKRGERRTVSKWAGGIGEAAFFGVLCLLGVAALATLLASPVVQPGRVSLAFGFGYWLMLLVVTSFILIGGTGFVWAILKLGTSAERRAAFSSSVGGGESPAAGENPTTCFPYIPGDDGLTNSPGIELAYRLPPSQSPVWQLLSAGVFAVLWNGITVMLLVWALQSFVNRRPEWFLSVTLVLFLGVGGWSIWYLCRQIWIHTGMGPTTLEVSDHPFIPRRKYQAVFTQSGNLRVRRLELWLICEEEATYRQGTDIRTEVGRVYECQIACDEEFVIGPSQPFRRACTLEIPNEAMHSFQAAHHAVHWRLVVRGDVEGWPAFERGFPIVVHPGEMTSRPHDSLPAARTILQPHLVFRGAGAGVSA